MYTIKLQRDDLSLRQRVLTALSDKIAKDGRFRINRIHTGIMPARGGKQHPTISLEGVRLIHKKAYCGNHPGECVINPFLGAKKKLIASYLEWDDWVSFHMLVNGVLNRLRISADVWTNPQDVRGKMWIRRGLLSRIKYDYTESYEHLVPTRHWNAGTPDQFAYMGRRTKWDKSTNPSSPTSSTPPGRRVRIHSSR